MILDLNKFLLFGDSITEYSYNQSFQKPLKDGENVHFTLGAALQNDYVRKLDIVQRGYGGYNTRVNKAILPLVLRSDHDDQPESKKIKIATIFLGTNDATESGVQAVPINEYADNLDFMVKLMKSRGIKVIVCTPTFHDATVWESLPAYSEESGHRSTARNLEYGEVAKKVAIENGVVICDIYQAFVLHAKKINVKPEQLLADGIHFNGEGYRAWYTALKETIEKNYPDLSSESLEQNLVPWREAVKDAFLEALQKEC